MQKLCSVDIPALDIDNYEHSGKLLARQAHEAAIVTRVHVCTLAACRRYVLMVSACTPCWQLGHDSGNSDQALMY